jgi:hypothetical protein
LSDSVGISGMFDMTRWRSLAPPALMAQLLNFARRVKGDTHVSEYD